MIVLLGPQRWEQGPVSVGIVGGSNARGGKEEQSYDCNLEEEKNYLIFQIFKDLRRVKGTKFDI